MVNKLSGKLIVILGIDGSGKSTVINSLEELGYRVTHWRRLRNIIKDLNFINPAQEVQTLDGEARLKFISKYIESEWKYLIKPYLERGVDVISDGYFVRFYAKEKVYQRLNIKRLKKHLFLPTNVMFILLDTPPVIALERKNEKS